MARPIAAVSLRRARRGVLQRSVAVAVRGCCGAERGPCSVSGVSPSSALVKILPSAVGAEDAAPIPDAIGVTCRSLVATCAARQPAPLIQCGASRAPVAQLDRVPGFEPGGRGFESLRARQLNQRHIRTCRRRQIVRVTTESPVGTVSISVVDPEQTGNCSDHSDQHEEEFVRIASAASSRVLRIFRKDVWIQARLVNFLGPRTLGRNQRRLLRRM